MARLQTTTITGSLFITSSTAATTAMMVTGSSYFSSSNFMVTGSKVALTGSAVTIGGGTIVFRGTTADFSGVGTVTLGANVTATPAAHTHDINTGTTEVLSVLRGGTGQAFVPSSIVDFGYSMPILSKYIAVSGDGKEPAAGEVPPGSTNGVIANTGLIYRASMIVASGSNFQSADWKMAINSATVNTLYTLYVNGNVGVNGTITELSTRTIKKNIVELGDELSNIMKLLPVEYDYIETNEHSVGFIAEEFNEIYPSLVVADEDGNPNSIAYQNLVSPIVKAIQQLSEKIDNLTKRVEELENK